VGEASWYKGLHDAQLVWHAWQVWRRFVGEQRLEMERRMLIAKRWHESRLAWRAFHVTTAVSLYNEQQKLNCVPCEQNMT
jgi:hypothetical protein